ncbi:MAG: septum formation inhibitor Maf [Rubrivivax sp. SCN 71-131]|jgi:septum formation protein|nr:MAG: septum formation inhibitor Maf [Rubrivivax sp. SCN 71-131]
MAQDLQADAAHAFVYLASQSPRRVQLLTQLGVAHEPLRPDVDEDAEGLERACPGELPLAYVQRVTLAKLGAARQRLARRGLPPAPILVADTTVALGRRLLGKPAHAGEARHMLQALSGRTHRVLTAVAVAVDGTAAGGTWQALETSVSRVRFAPLGQEVIERYVASGEPFGKAGAYAIQGRIAAWIEHLSGSYSGVMGLPLFETARLLARAGVRIEA